MFLILIKQQRQQKRTVGKENQLLEMFSFPHIPAAIFSSLSVSLNPFLRN